MLKQRTLEKTIKKAAKTFPAIVVTGPRQSGKTTLLKALTQRTHRFVSLEDPDVRIRAKEDPRRFFELHRPPLVIDEIQYVPELLSYIKTQIDEDRSPGQWMLTGSQNFVLMQGVSQSLAGRAAILSLLPFSYAERIDRTAQSMAPSSWVRALDPRTMPRVSSDVSLATAILRGGYPELARSETVDRQVWCASYIATYLERDVRNLAHVGDMSAFERFLRLCAIRTGQLLNLSDLARDIGISVPTAKRWISILETGYQISLLPAYYENVGKRFVKRPKLYFTDTALATYLLGIHDPETLLHTPTFGALFETMIVTDVLKRFLHVGAMPSLYYMETHDGFEIDLVVEDARQLFAYEIKSAATITRKHAGSLDRISEPLRSRIARRAVISAARESFPLADGIDNVRWQDALAL